MKRVLLEQLIALALLHAEGFDVWDSFASQLDRLYLNHPDSEILFRLETSPTEKDAVLHTLSLLNTDAIADVDLFGRALMSALSAEYQNGKTDLRTFAERGYDIWQILPSDMADSDPFFILCYAGDPLSWGDEKQCRKHFENAFSYYKTLK